MLTTASRPNSPFCCTLLAAILALAPGLLLAQPPSHTAREGASTKVSFTDLDLTSSGGQLAAKERLSAAANRLCQKFSDSRKVDSRASAEDCYRETIGAALRQLNTLVARVSSRDSQLAQNQR
jgi:UrcA family protein